MGGGNSRPMFVAYQEARVRCKSELSNISGGWKKVRGADKQLHLTDLCTIFNQSFATLLFDALLNGNRMKKTKMTFEEFLQGYAMICDGNSQERVSFCFEVFDSTHDNVLTANEFRESLTAICGNSYDLALTLLIIPSGNAIIPSREQHQKAVQSVCRQFIGNPPQAKIKYEHFAQWLSKYGQIAEFIKYSVQRIISRECALPETLKIFKFATPPLMFGGNSDLMSGEISALVRSWMPEPYCKCQFYRLYSSQSLGFAIGTLFRTHSHKAPQILKDPSLLVIKDDGGHIFGGFFTKAWHKHANKFYGSEDSFVFSLAPECAVYRCTGENQHIMYSTPEMLAVGGKLNYFGFEIDAEMNRGKSHTCVTYDCPRLAHSEEFRCVTIELWGLVDSAGTKALLGYDSDEEIDLDALHNNPLSGKSVLNRVENWTLDFLEGRGYSKNTGLPPEYREEDTPETDAQAPTESGSEKNLQT